MCVWEVCVCVCFVFSHGPGEPTSPIYLFRNRPGITVSAPGRPFTPIKSWHPGGRLIALLRCRTLYNTLPGAYSENAPVSQ